MPPRRNALRKLAVSFIYSCFLERFFFFFFFFFNHKWMLNFVKSFFSICWDDHMVSFFNLLMWCNTLIDLWIMKNACIPGINPSWPWFWFFYFIVGFCLLAFYWRILCLCSAVISSVQFSSATQSCQTLCDTVNRSTPVVHHQLPEFIHTHVHRVSDAI